MKYLLMLLLVGSVSAEQFAVYTPADGGFVIPAEEGTYKELDFVLWTGTLFEKNPDAKILVTVDGNLSAKGSLGRAITIGAWDHCHGIGFADVPIGGYLDYPCNEVEFQDRSNYRFSLDLVNDQLMLNTWGPAADSLIGTPIKDQTEGFDTVFTVYDAPVKSVFVVHGLKQVVVK